MRGVFTVRGNLLPMRSIFKKLKMKWMSETGGTNKKLAEMIGVTPQVASTYASGTDNRTPPFSAILTLCEELDLEIVIRPNKIFLQDNSEKINV